MSTPTAARRRLATAVGCALLVVPIAATTTGPATADRAGPGRSAHTGATALTADPAWDLDPGFGETGLAAGPSYETSSAVAAEGQETWYAGSVVGKLTASGALDTSVARGRGFAVVQPPGAEFATSYAVVIDDQGRPVVAGTAYTPDSDRVSPMMVARFTPDLQPDPTFGDHGTRLISSPGTSYASDVQLQPDGSIVVAGSAGSLMQVVRLTPDGGLDPTFGGGDGITTIGSETVPAGGRGLSLTSDAKVVVAGYVGRAAGGTQGAVVQLLPDGTPDPSFGEHGIASVPGPALRDVVRTPGGQLAVVGPTHDRDGSAAVRLVRLSSTGRLAAWPGSTRAQRTLVLDSLHQAEPTALALQHSGKLVVSGSGSRDASYPTQGYLVVRTLADGRAAPDFGDRGHVLVGWGNSDNEDLNDITGEAVTVDARDQIVVGGHVVSPSLSGVGVARFARASPPVPATTQLRQTAADGSWRSCGKPPAGACRVVLGQPVRFGGRSWPVPDDDSLRLQVQGLDGSDNTLVPTGATPEGNFATSFTPTLPGHYRVRVKVPDSGTTLLTAGPWRYLDVS